MDADTLKNQKNELVKNLIGHLNKKLWESENQIAKKMKVRVTRTSHLGIK